MKKIFIFAIIILLFFGLVYFGQAQKATEVNRVRIKMRYEKKEISEEQCRALLKRNTLLNNLLNPQVTRGID
jgi:uncharacterized membrane protein